MAVKRLHKPKEYQGNTTEFTGQPFPLLCGKYECKNGIFYHEDKKAFSFPHPVMITKFIKNISRRTVKVELAYRRYGKWEYVEVEKEIISKSKSITSLSNLGIMVTDDNAKGLVQFLHWLEIYNEKNIPVVLAASSFGYVKNHGFLPYCDNIEFDGKNEFKRIFESIQQQGDFEHWKKNLAFLFQHSKKINTVVSASFASVLLNPVGGQPFFAHLYGIDSGTGKTAALHIAASVWGNPEKYKISFNSTSVSTELYAGVLNEFPLCIDELQLKNDDKNKKHFNPYLLCSGEGKSRATKEIGLRETFNWNNAIITTGETRLSSESGGAGELNRIIEFEVESQNDLFLSPQLAGSYFEFTKNNHGHAGRIFVEWFYGGNYANNVELAKKLVTQFESELLTYGISSKQARSGAFILAANKLANAVIWGNESELLLTAEWLSKSLKTENAVDITLRAYEKICDWVSVNNNKFIHKYNYRADDGQTAVVTSDVMNDCYGEYDRTDEQHITVYINKTVFDKVCEDFKFDPRAVLSGLKRKNLIKTKNGRNTQMKRIEGCPTNVVSVIINIDFE